MQQLIVTNEQTTYNEFDKWYVMYG